MTEMTTVEQPKVNKSRLVFAAFKKSGLKTPSQDIIDLIKKEDDVEVTPNLVNVLRSKLKNIREAKKAKREGSKTVAAPDDVFDKLVAVKEFATKMGGLTELKGLVEKLESLTM